MKQIILCLTALLLLFAACQKSCIPKKPKNLKPPRKIHVSLASPHIGVKNYSGILQLQAIFDTCDLTKKCFVKGRLEVDKIFRGICVTVHPRIRLF